MVCTGEKKVCDNARGITETAESTDERKRKRKGKNGRRIRGYGIGDGMAGGSDGKAGGVGKNG